MPRYLRAAEDPLQSVGPLEPDGRIHGRRPDAGPSHAVSVQEPDLRRARRPAAIDCTGRLRPGKGLRLFHCSLSSCPSLIAPLIFPGPQRLDRGRAFLIFLGLRVQRAPRAQPQARVGYPRRGAKARIAAQPLAIAAGHANSVAKAQHGERRRRFGSPAKKRSLR